MNDYIMSINEIYKFISTLFNIMMVGLVATRNLTAIAKLVPGGGNITHNLRIANLVNPCREPLSNEVSLDMVCYPESTIH